MNTVDLSIIIVTYNSEDTINACLKSIYRQASRYRFEIIVVDNDSADETVARIQQHFPEVILVEGKTNLGFSKANNLGAKVALGKYLLFINPDVIVSDGALDGILRFYQQRKDKRIGLVGPRLLNQDGSIQPSCREFPSLKNMITHALFLNKLFPGIKAWGNYMMTYFDFTTNREVQWLTGACLLTERDLFFRVGQFDERFFLFSEDVDLCWRYYKAGYKSFFFTKVKMLHFVGNSSPLLSVSRGRYEQQGMNMLLRIHYPPLLKTPFRIINVIHCLLRILLWGTLGAALPSSRRQALRRINYYSEMLRTTFQEADDQT